MKAKVERDLLLKALSHVSNVADKQSVANILGNVLLTLDAKGFLRLCATDNEVELHETISVPIETPGETSVPAQILHQIVDKLPSGAEIELGAPAKGERLAEDGGGSGNDGAEGAEGSTLQLRCGKAKFLLQSLPGDDFPFLSGQEEASSHQLRLAGKDLRRLFSKTRSAISDAGPRYYLQGVYLHRVEAEGGGTFLRAVATDGHRLAQVQLAQPDLPADLPAAIVPRKAVHEVLRLLDENSEAEVELKFAANKISFAFPHQLLTSKLIDGQFPDYDRVIPKGNDKQVSMDVKDFSRKIASVAAISTEAARAVRLKLNKDVMLLESTRSETGSARDELAVQYAEDEIEIGFNANYLRDIAEQIEGDAVTMELKDSNSPALLRDAGDADTLYILMPMRV